VPYVSASGKDIPAKKVLYSPPQKIVLKMQKLHPKKKIVQYLWKKTAKIVQKLWADLANSH